jgi:hypothetical protein
VSAAEVSQEKALRLLEQRLEQVYARQADFYEAEQRRLMGDPESRALDQIEPKLREAFVQYSEERLPYVLKIINLAGFPDSNPKNLPPPDNLRPVPKDQWLKAMDARTKLNSIDRGYSSKVTALLADAERLADADRFALLKKVDDFRRTMEERAMKEAANPLQLAVKPIVLSLSRQPPPTLQAVPPVSVTIPGSPAMPPPPKVDFGDPLSPMGGQRGLLEEELKIWLANHDEVLATKPSKKLPDKTQEFAAWISQLKAGL